VTPRSPPRGSHRLIRWRDWSDGDEPPPDPLIESCMVERLLDAEWTQNRSVRCLTGEPPASRRVPRAT
jgi:hypothetical protein